VSPPRVDQVNVVLSDVDAASHFLAGLGLELPAAPAGWEAHHRSFPAAGSVHPEQDRAEPLVVIELDSDRFARRWGGLPPSFAGVVLNVRVDEREEVDRLHEVALGLGATSLAGPSDAFWGSRFAVVQGPGPLVVGLASPPDERWRSAPPDPTSLT
jgi:catechol 2,3-dioxygenase-like lactoylglutathione lyase family enzyme